MGMTMTQKILAAHAGLESVKAGQLIEANLDLVLGNDITSPVAVKEFEKFGVKNVFDKDKIAIVPDHFTPNKDIKAAEQCKFIREFSREKGITNFFEIGEMGIEHCLLPEKGLVVAGTALTGMEGTTTRFQLQGPRVILTRSGTVNSQMVFEEGRQHTSLYETPFGELSVDIQTSVLKHNLTERGGLMEIKYSIAVEHTVTGKNCFKIRVKRKN